MEAARVPQQLLGELFVEKGLITAEELAETLAEQKETGKRIGQILVTRGFISGPALTTVLAEQLGVEMEKQEGFGAGLWSEIKRRHPRGSQDDDLAPSELAAEPPEAHERRLALIDEMDHGVDPEPDELATLRQQLAFASHRLEEERDAHQGTQRLLEESRSELLGAAHEVDDWRDRSAQAEAKENEQAAAELARLEAEVAELRAELDVRDRGLAAGAEAQAQLAAEAGRLEEELKALRDEHSGSKDAITALTAQVDELRAGGAESQRLLDKERTAAAALEATVTELRAELAARDQVLDGAAEARTALEGELEVLQGERDASNDLEQELSVVRDDVARLEQVSEQRKAKVKELAQQLRSAREGAAAFEAASAELRDKLSSREQKAEQSRQKVGELQAELAASEEARSREAAARIAAEAERGKLRSGASALSRSLEEERAAHGAARREVGKLRSRSAELEALEPLLAQANADVGARMQSVVELTSELKAVQAELAERPEPPPIEEPAASHVVFLPTAKGYSLAELPGPAPEPGAYEDVGDLRFVVSRIGPSPLPADTRRCAFLEVA